MKRLFIIISIACGVCVLGCSSFDDEVVANQIVSPREEQLATVLGNLVENRDVTSLQDDYIIYTYEDDSYLVMNQEDYELFTAFASLLTKDCTEEVKHSEPQGNGWIYYGKGE